MGRLREQQVTNTLSLKVRLGLGAALLAAGSVLTALILYVGMQAVAARLDTALAAETRMTRYANLSTQVSTFLIVATEAVQTGQSTEIRRERIAPVSERLRGTFALLQGDVEKAVRAVQSLGLDAQSRYGTQSLGLARMQALLDSTLRGLREQTSDQARLRAQIDGFAAQFDPLLNQAVNSEALFRNTILAGIEKLRFRLSTAALVIAGLTLVLVSWFYFGLIRPQLARLDRLREAAQQIEQADFTVSLPTTRSDEIGQLYFQTNRMAAALSKRQDHVQAEWDRLNDTIAQRTEELRAANVTLSEIDRNRRRFFADVSHELRTPLTVILMEAQIGRQEGGASADAFATIEARAARLNRRIDDLLRVARSDSGQLALEPKVVPLAGLLDAVVDEVGAELDNAGMELRVDHGSDVSLQCDANWVRQVLVSLTRNAIRHARDGGIVRIISQEQKTDVTIAITDNGPGIAACDQERIFDRFVQSGTTDAQGFGIGLALAQWVVEAQGGAVSLTSPVPEDQALGAAPGTKIVVRLPRAEG